MPTGRIDLGQKSMLKIFVFLLTMNAFYLDNACAVGIDFSSQTTTENRKFDLMLADRWRVESHASVHALEFLLFHAYVALTL